ncbi:MAG: hypothetical protein ACREQ5_32235, partial [Candidatus Dormibacteria bacterium]
MNANKEPLKMSLYQGYANAGTNPASPTGQNPWTNVYKGMGASQGQIDSFNSEMAAGGNRPYVPPQQAPQPGWSPQAGGGSIFTGAPGKTNIGDPNQTLAQYLQTQGTNGDVMQRAMLFAQGQGESGKTPTQVWNDYQNAPHPTAQQLAGWGN